MVSEQIHLKTCPDIGKSRAGSAFIEAGGAVSWASKLVGNASLSSCESKYMGLTLAAQEASYLRSFQMQMSGKAAVARPIRILMDSQPAIDIVHKPMYHPRSNKFWHGIIL